MKQPNERISCYAETVSIEECLDLYTKESSPLLEHGTVGANFRAVPDCFYCRILPPRIPFFGAKD